MQLKHLPDTASFFFPHMQFDCIFQQLLSEVTKNMFYCV